LVKNHITTINIFYMRSTLLSFIFALFFVGLASAQFADKGFSFQGYARDFEGAALGSQTISVKFSVYPQGKAVVYEEAFSLTTDPYGVFHAVIGSSRPADFAKIDWPSANHWLKVEVKAQGGDYVEISNSSLLSVPYANAAFNGVPSGTIMAFGGSKDKIPAGFVACDGTEYQNSQLPGLFAAIGYSWGGNGSSTFRVPDLRGQFLRGQNDNSGVDPDAGGRYAKNGGKSGDNVGSFQGDQFRSHNHGGSTSTDGNHSHSVPRYDGWAEASGTYWGDIVTKNGSGSVNSSTNGNHSHTISSNGGSETRPTNASVYYIIKL
jgi:microcystin-dependent protein